MQQRPLPPPFPRPYPEPKLPKQRPLWQITVAVALGILIGGALLCAGILLLYGIYIQSVVTSLNRQTAATQTPVEGVVILGRGETSTPVLIIPARDSYKHNLSVTEDYNRIKNLTTVTLDTPAEQLKDIPTLSLNYSYDGTKPTPPNEVTVAIFYSSSAQPKHLGCNDASVLIDGSIRMSFAFPKARYVSRDVRNVPNAEGIELKFAAQDFLVLANADEVEMEVCGVQFPLTEQHLQGLKDAASRMRP